MDEFQPLAAGAAVDTVGVVCVICRREADPVEDGDPPLGWSADLVETRGGPAIRRICPACTRAHVRSIEAKLDSVWW